MDQIWSRRRTLRGVGAGVPQMKRAGNRVRTDDLLITNQLLYQLSYAGVLAPAAGAKRAQADFSHGL